MNTTVVFEEKRRTKAVWYRIIYYVDESKEVWLEQNCHV